MCTKKHLQKGGESDAYWSGGVDIAATPNETITTELPIRALLDEHNRLLARLKETSGEASPLAETATTGVLKGTFRLDQMSAGAPGAVADEPGLYALLGKLPNTIGDERRRRDDYDENGSVEGNGDTSGNGGGDADARCKDTFTDRNIACKISLQWFVITDIGLTYYKGPDELYVIARSLATGKALHNAKIQLLAANNRVLDEQASDGAGVAKFKTRATTGGEGNRLAAIVAYFDKDFSFVDFRRDAFDLSAHGTAGRRAPKFFDAYLYTDRGIYRPEESIHATILLRDVDGNAAKRVPPVTVKLRASNGKVIDERRIEPSSWKLGGNVVQLQVPATAPLGQADLLAFVGEQAEPIGAATLMLDHFRPDRARISFVNTDRWSLKASAEQGIRINGFVDAQYLYGHIAEGSTKTDAPARDLTAEATILVQRAATPFEGCYAGYGFDGLEDEFTPLLFREVLPNKTDEKGDLSFETISKLPHGDHPLEARLTLTLFDEGGKVGQQSRIMHVPLERQWLGVRHEARLLPSKPGMLNFKLTMLALTTSNQARAAKLKLRLFRERSVFIWHQASSSWRYQPEVQRTLVKETEVPARDASDLVDGCRVPNAEAEFEIPLGRYYLEVVDDAGQRVTTRLEGGWQSADVNRPSPDRLEIRADAPMGKADSIPAYMPGDTATFSIDAPFEGEVLLSIVNDRVHLWDSTQSTVDRQAKVRIKIDPEWAGNAFYAMATVFRRNTDGTVAHGPSRAIGAVYFAVDREAERRANVEIQTTDQVSPERPLHLKLVSQDLKGEAWATVYALDEGLISLTNHLAPDPYRHIFGRRALGIEVIDNYGRILLAERPRDRSGGDRSRRLFLSNYISDRIVAQFTGPVEFINGTAEVQLPAAFEFAGTVRIAAIAWNDRKVGAATKSVLTRQALVADLRLPRFLTLGDVASVPFAVHRLSALPGRYRLTLLPEAPLRLDRLASSDGLGAIGASPNSIELDLARRRSADLRANIAVSSDAVPTTANLQLQIEGAEPGVQDDLKITRLYAISLRPSEPPSTEIAFAKLAPGETLTLNREQLLQLTNNRFHQQNLSVKVQASADLMGALPKVLPDSAGPQVAMLERLVWRASALLAAGDDRARRELPPLIREIEALQASDGYFAGYRLVNETGLHESRDIVDRTNDADGQFERYETWRTALALDFLMRGRAAGYRVSSAGLQLGITALTDRLRQALRNFDADEYRSSRGGDDDQDRSARNPRLQLVEDRDDLAEAARALSRIPANVAANQPPEVRKPPPAARHERRRSRGENEDTSAWEYRRVSMCDGDMLYAAFILVQIDALDRFDLANLANGCGVRGLRPLPTAILAAALNHYGELDEARVVSTSIDAAGGAKGPTRSDAQSDGSYDAMLLAFLAIAHASPTMQGELADRILGQQGTARPLSLATRAWLMRAYAATARDASKAVRLSGTASLQQRPDGELSSEYVRLGEFAQRPLNIRNDGPEPAYLALLFRGFPNHAANATGAGLKITRRYLNQRGEEINPGAVPLTINDVLYVVLSGEREDLSDGDDPAKLQDPLVISDSLASAFEIVDRDVFELQKSGGVAMRAVLPGEGKIDRLRVAEARDDQLLAIVKPDPEGKFQIAYSLRVVSQGDFVLPGTLVEDLYRSELMVRTEATRVHVDAARRP
jgi:uncharacterized protein YfaS (alpha-2-macroglobulin family)